MERTIPLIASLALGAMLAGCNAETGIFREPGGPAVAIQVSVRDLATTEPIAGATVSAETASRDHPFSAASVLGQTGPEIARAKTDAGGQAVVRVLQDREYRIVVWAPGQAPVVFGANALTGSAGQWLDAELPTGMSASGIQIRIGMESR